MTLAGKAIHAVLITTLLAGCAGGADPSELANDEGRVEVTTDALEESNALTPNALTPNALTPNALTPNALTPNALTPNALTPNALTALTNDGADGEVSRQLLKYTVGCALTPAQSFSLTWTDGQGLPRVEVYWGSLGLAPEWQSGPLSVNARRWVSACLGSRLNYYGVSVMLSARGEHPQLSTVGLLESMRYTMREGAFWGDLFGPTPYLYACHHEPNVGNSRMRLRECAAGHVEDDGSVVGCGIVEIVGACEDWCSPITTKGGYHLSCGAPSGETSSIVVTTYLP